MSFVRLIVVSAALIGAAACSSNSSSSPTPIPSPAPPPSTPNGPSATTIAIPMGAETLGDRAFVPDVLNAAVGTTVTWTNTDVVDHTSTSNQGAWNSGVIRAGGQFSFTLQNPGTFEYHCTIHPGMVGAIVVQ